MIRARELWSGAVSKFKKPHPALKHGAYSSTALLPGKNAADFEKLHHAVIAEFAPMGALEEDIVATIAGLIWRKQNLTKFSIAELARKRLVELGSTEFPSTDISPVFEMLSQSALLEVYRATLVADQLRKDLGDAHGSLGLDDIPTLDRLVKGLASKNDSRKLRNGHVCLMLPPGEP